MRSHLILFLVLFTAVSFLIVPEPGLAQPECVEVWFILEGASDPPCGIEPVPNLWAIEVTSSPTSVSAGSCDNQTLDNRHTDVKFFPGGCDGTTYSTCTILATSTLSGRYEIIGQVGTCLKVCELCP